MKSKFTLIRAKRSLIFLKRYFILAAVVICIRGSVYVLSHWYDIRYQYTDSIPGKIYLIVKNKIPQKGDLVAFWPPPSNIYKHTCFIKYVKGIAGEFIKREGLRFYLNSEFIGEAKKYSLKGLPLFPSEGGVILKDHYFVWTPHKDSYDSRYKDIGTISSANIIGTAYRLL
ncbi:MAG: S26 family signal peptidase [Oligoflexia bacterium]|nr:S26 family signal peptidase [Oligoflexia bacterium]